MKLNAYRLAETKKSQKTASSRRISRVRSCRVLMASSIRVLAVLKRFVQLLLPCNEEYCLRSSSP